MNTKISTDDLSLQQLADSFFPTGLYSTSNGLEALYYAKNVNPKDIKKLRDFSTTTGGTIGLYRLE